MTLSVIALGGNLGDPKQNIAGALEAINQSQNTRVLRSSSLVESFAVTLDGVDTALPHYLNAVAEIETDLSPRQLLSFLNSVEQDFGRVRNQRWAPRTLDIDIITFGDLVLETEDLVIPHPRAYQRGFVLVPWLELDPGAELPGFGKIAPLAEAVAAEVWSHEEN